MRLLTRADFDGLACAAVLKELGIIDCWKLVHPKDMQDGLVEVTDNDVLANVPYVKGCKLWFDHHSSEEERVAGVNFEGASYHAPSAARVIFDYYNGAAKLPHLKEMVSATDQVDSGRLSKEDIAAPSGWVLLGFIMDPRTGLGRVKDFTVNNFVLMDILIDACRTMNIDQILQLPDVQERVREYQAQNEKYINMILQYSRISWDMIITDLRGVSPIYTGNRFLMYSLFPDQNISIWIVDGSGKQNCVFAVGYSVVNRTATVDVGKLMLHYGGGGHRMVGTCQVPYADADQVLDELIDAIQAAEAATEKPGAELLSLEELEAILQEYGALF